MRTRLHNHASEVTARSSPNLKANVRFMKTQQIIILSLVLLSTGCMSGCATSMVRSSSSAPPLVYPATAWDCLSLYEVTVHGETFYGRLEWWQRPFGVLFFVIDTPISLVTDTLHLPGDLYKCVKSDEKGIEQPDRAVTQETAPSAAP